MRSFKIRLFAKESDFFFSGLLILMEKKLFKSESLNQLTSRKLNTRRFFILSYKFVNEYLEQNSRATTYMVIKPIFTLRLTCDNIFPLFR